MSGKSESAAERADEGGLRQRVQSLRNLAVFETDDNHVRERVAARCARLNSARSPVVGRRETLDVGADNGGQHCGARRARSLLRGRHRCAVRRCARAGAGVC